MKSARRGQITISIPIQASHTPASTADSDKQTIGSSSLDSFGLVNIYNRILRVSMIFTDREPGLQILTDIFFIRGQFIEEIQSLDPVKVAVQKARGYYAKLQKPILVEDVSLSFSALHGLPGPYINDFMKSILRVL